MTGIGHYTMTSVHVVILNLPPDMRYEPQNTIQLFVAPGPRPVVDLFSFLAPVMEELRHLQEKGMAVKTSSGE